MELVLVRHTSVDVAPGTCYGQTDVSLASTFELEAATVAEQLKNDVFDKVYCSPLSRCRRLVEYCGMKNIEYDERLLEINLGEWEMRRFDDITDKRLEEWYADYINVPAPGGESFMDQYLRFKNFVEDLSKMPYDKVAIFAHGGILMQAMLMWEMATIDTLFSMQPKYGQVLRLKLAKQEL